MILPSCFSDMYFVYTYMRLPISFLFFSFRQLNKLLNLFFRYPLNVIYYTIIDMYFVYIYIQNTLIRLRNTVLQVFHKTRFRLLGSGA